MINFRRWFVFGLIAVLYVSFPNARPDLNHYNAGDSENYLSLSSNLVSGRGYTRILTPGAYVPHTTWPPGLPVLLMPSVAFSGETLNYFFVKGTMIFVGLFGILMLWIWSARMTGSTIRADTAALLVALNPYYWDFSHIAMAEVPSLAWIFASLVLIDVAWRANSARGIAVPGSGMFVGTGMLIKGTVIGLGGVPVVYAFRDYAQKVRFWPRSVIAMLGFGVLFLVPFFLWSLRNASIDTGDLGFDGINQVEMLAAKVPTDPSAGTRSLIEILHDSINSFKWYVIYNIPEQVVPFVKHLGLRGHGWGSFVALIMTVFILILALPRTFFTWIIWMVLLPMVLMNQILVNGGSARYWVPISVLLLIAVVLQFPTRYFRVLGRKFHFALLSIAVISLTMHIFAQEKQPYSDVKPFKEFVELALRLRPFCEAEKPVVNTVHSATFSHLSGCTGYQVRPEFGANPDFTHVLYDSNFYALKVQASEIERQGSWLLVSLDTARSSEQIPLVIKAD